MPRVAELHEAFFFVCDECGRDSLVRFVSFTPEEAAEILADHPEEDREAAEAFLEEVRRVGGAYVPPQEATCEHCGARYDEVSLPGDREEEDDGD